VQAEILPLMKRGAGWGNKRASVGVPADPKTLENDSNPACAQLWKLLLACRPWMPIPDSALLLNAMCQDTAVLAVFRVPISNW
jgi:hypothetical protein